MLTAKEVQYQQVDRGFVTSWAAIKPHHDKGLLAVIQETLARGGFDSKNYYFKFHTMDGEAIYLCLPQSRYKEANLPDFVLPVVIKALPPYIECHLYWDKMPLFEYEGELVYFDVYGNDRCWELNLHRPDGTIFACAASKKYNVKGVPNSPLIHLDIAREYDGLNDLLSHGQKTYKGGMSYFDYLSAP